MNITPEVLEHWLKAWNLSRREFIETFNLQPLVYVPELPLSLKALFSVLYLLIFTLALLGNCLIITKNMKMPVKNSTCIFITSLAVSDLLISVFCIPFTLLQHLSANWIAGEFLCKMISFVQTMAVSTEILTMVCIAVERFQGVLHPLRPRSTCTSLQGKKLTAVVWLSAMAIASPLWYAQKIEVQHDFLFEVHYICCQEVWHQPQQRKAYTTIILLLVFLVPLMTLAGIYGKVAYELWFKHRVYDSVFQALSRAELNKRTRKKKHAVKKMVAVVIVFAVCWTPFHLVVMLSDYGKLQLNAEKETILFASVQLLGFSNSTCNPIIYMALKENLKSFCRTLRCQRRRMSWRALGKRVEQNPSQPCTNTLPIQPRSAWAIDPGQGAHFSQVHTLTIMDPINSQFPRAQGDLPEKTRDAHIAFV
ncbi:pyroglutamylated RF-amide peptide receptor-like [Pristis pectinata]|uniref:pyroglutamylated RF-amide peptide receptor-like n=1 Tax=Pristis pectinata TaxID=685728 RepID=UPI00223DF9BE|nr:pyroglutamylated RF-amide peptide receptor-like [Pristis pectinata]